MTSPVAPAVRLPVPGGLQMTVRFNDGGQPAACVLGASGGGEGGLTQAKATTWLQAFATAFMPVLPSTVAITGATVRDVGQVDGQVVDVGPPTTNGSGGRSGGRVVAAGSVLVKWSTARGGRSGKGRTFLPGVTPGDVAADGRTYATTFAPIVASAISSYLSSSALSGIALAPAILSFTKGDDFPITGGALAPVVGIQRRRMRA